MLRKLRRKNKMKYFEEDLETDISWLYGLGVDEDDAKAFIMRLLNSEFIKIKEVK
jgi:hypothetical protein